MIHQLLKMHIIFHAFFCAAQSCLFLKDRHRCYVL